jgi:hypothetical protein
MQIQDDGAYSIDSTMIDVPRSAAEAKFKIGIDVLICFCICSENTPKRQCETGGE